MKIRNHQKCLKKPVPAGADWRTPFLHGTAVAVTYAMADTIKITHSGSCTAHQMLLAYVTQFSHGGFWLVDEAMFVVTSGVNSDKEATYADAVEFISNWQSS